MSTDRKAASGSLDDALQALSLSPGLPLAPDGEVVPPQPETNPNSMLAQVLRSHPGLTPEEASEMLIAFGSHPDLDVGVIHAWRRSGQRAYERTPAHEPDEEAQP
jgi:hypothetical protein